MKKAIKHLEKMAWHQNQAAKEYSKAMKLLRKKTGGIQDDEESERLL